jgi:hypothetical protein
MQFAARERQVFQDTIQRIIDSKVRLVISSEVRARTIETANRPLLLAQQPAL